MLGRNNAALCEKEEFMERILISLKYGLLPGIKESFMEELEDDSGMGTIEVVLILVVLIALVIIFKGKIQQLLNDVFNQIDTDAKKVYVS